MHTNKLAARVILMQRVPFLRLIIHSGSLDSEKPSGAMWPQSCLRLLFIVTARNCCPTQFSTSQPRNLTACSWISRLCTFSPDGARHAQFSSCGICRAVCRTLPDTSRPPLIPLLAAASGALGSSAIDVRFGPILLQKSSIKRARYLLGVWVPSIAPGLFGGRGL